MENAMEMDIENSRENVKNFSKEEGSEGSGSN